MNKNFKLNCAGRILNLERTLIMGVLNVTPDSFYENSRCYSIDQSLKRSEEMINDGVDIIDVGGESTSKMVQRYGHGSEPNSYFGDQYSENNTNDSVLCEHELSRVIPVVEELVKNFDCVISVDTSSAAVIKEASLAGAGMINDVRALQRPGALEAAANTNLPVILMHSLVDHPEIGYVPHYNNLIADIMTYLRKAIKRCKSAGIEHDKLIIDPGFGGGLFGKTPSHDLSLLKHLNSFHELDLPILAGMSRKSFIGSTLDKASDKRLAGSLTAAAMATQSGVHILRVHDIAETSDVVRMVEAVHKAE